MSLLRPLPPRANLEHLRNEAKQRLKTLRAQDPSVKLTDAQLAIAREYALAHGGRIDVLDRSDGKRGAQFRLLLPLAAVDAAALNTAQSPPSITIQEEG